MEETLSASARRAVDAAAIWARRSGAAQIDPAHLLLAIAEQEESRGASVLAAFGQSLDTLQVFLAADTVESPPVPRVAIVQSERVRDVLNRARARSLALSRGNPAGTDILLLELVTVPDLRDRLSSHGVNVDAIERQLLRDLEADNKPLATEFANLEIDDASDAVDTYRILDACCNRAREGLRVLEDFARFARDDLLLASQLKAIRHDLRAVLEKLPRAALLASRDTEHDVGTTCTTESEFSRTHPLDVVAANFKRTQEALRSLEEFGKLEGAPLASSIEAARYRLYTLERAMLLGFESQARLAGVLLYVLVNSDQCPGGLEWTVAEALAGGAEAIQLREKSRPDREVLELARRLRLATRQRQALLIVNDRPDIARLVDADGVHVGQEELSVKDARRIVGPNALVGVSVHSIEQARQAVLDGASYLGVGPTFPSSTKSFETFPGVDLIRRLSSEIRLPAFAIGGINLDSIDGVLAAGACRVAVSAAVCGAADPRTAAAQLRRRLER